MKHVQKTQQYIGQNAITNTFFQEDCIFFDIETTGFSPKNSNIYLIGCLHKKGTDLIIEQFFAETKEEEQEVLEKFIELLDTYKTIISFNGIGFDIPFIKAKCDSYKICEHFSEFQYIDIFKEISRIKFLLKLPNYKQKTIESFLGIHRDDRFSGGELIQVYEDYVNTKSPEQETLLLLHNFDDVMGMLDLFPILAYTKILSGAYSIHSAETASYTSYEGEEDFEFIITLQNDFIAPKRVSHQYKDYYLTINKDITKIRIPIYEGELKYFYPNYKEYYYLPVEDMAIHHSVASFVDKQYREKAKASNCYTRKCGRFLPQYDTILNPAFKKDHKDKCTFFELTEDFKSSNTMLKKYTEHIFYIIRQTRK